MKLWFSLAIIAGLVGCARAPVDATVSAQVDIPAGMAVAQRFCGGCHAVDAGQSPMADAPPFSTLHQRYRAGCLEVALSEGMLEASHPPEEGSSRHHPRMPMAVLADDQRSDLTAYLKGLDPRPTPDQPQCPKAPPAA